MDTRGGELQSCKFPQICPSRRAQQNVVLSEPTRRARHRPLSNHFKSANLHNAIFRTMIANAASAVAITEAVELLESLFDNTATKRVGFRLWDGPRWPDDRARHATLVLNHPDALEHMLLPGTEAGLAEAYLRNDFDVEGDVEAAIDLAQHLLNHDSNHRNGSRWLGVWRHLPTGAKLRAVGRLLPQGLGAIHSRERD